MLFSSRTIVAIKSGLWGILRNLLRHEEGGAGSYLYSPDLPRTEIALEVFTESDPMLTFWAHLFPVLALSSGTF